MATVKAEQRGILDALMEADRLLLEHGHSPATMPTIITINGVVFTKEPGSDVFGYVDTPYARRVIARLGKSRAFSPN